MITHRIQPGVRALCAIGLLAATLPTWAQKAPVDDRPAVETTPVERPTVEMPTKPAAASSGTNIIGDRESPIGLYITPWRNASAEADIDHPARLLSLELDPVDKRVFARQVEYYDALTAASRAKAARSAPAAPSP